MSVTSLRPVALPNVASPSLRFSFVTPLSAISLGGVRARVCCSRMNANMCVCVCQSPSRSAGRRRRRIWMT